jgi:hypothetical protein
VPARGRVHGLVQAVIVAAVVAIGLILVSLSPVFLAQLDRVDGVNWTRLSEIGQTYGAASAILAMLALGGIAASLFVQARQAKADQVHAIRALHTELVRIELDDVALYQPCWGPLDIATEDGKRQHIYTTLLMNYAWMGYEVGSIPEPWLEDMLAGVFDGEVGRRYWTWARQSWAHAAGGSRRGRRFLRIVDDACARAIAAGPPAPVPPRTRGHDAVPSPPASPRWHGPVAVAVGVAGGFLVARALAAARRR